MSIGKGAPAHSLSITLACVHKETGMDIYGSVVSQQVQIRNKPNVRQGNGQR